MCLADKPIPTDVYIKVPNTYIGMTVRIYPTRILALKSTSCTIYLVVKNYCIVGTIF